MNPELSILIPVRDEEENVKIISNKIEKEIIIIIVIKIRPINFLKDSGNDLNLFK